MGQILLKNKQLPSIPPLVHEPLYPIDGRTATKTEIAVGVLKRDFQSLQDRCIEVILS